MLVRRAERESRVLLAFDISMFPRTSRQGSRASARARLYAIRRLCPRPAIARTVGSVVMTNASKIMDAVDHFPSLRKD